MNFKNEQKGSKGSGLVKFILVLAETLARRTSTSKSLSSVETSFHRLSLLYSTVKIFNNSLQYLSAPGRACGACDAM